MRIVLFPYFNCDSSPHLYFDNGMASFLFVVNNLGSYTCPSTLASIYYCSGLHHPCALLYN